MQFTEQAKRTQILYFYVTVESNHAGLLSCYYKSKLKKNQDFSKRFYHLYLRPLLTQETSLDMHIISLFILTEPKINNFF